MKAKRRTPQALERTVIDLLLAVAPLNRLLRTEDNSSELTLSQIGVLARLEQGGWMTNAELARQKSMKPQSMSAIVASLEKKAMIERRPHPTDGRQVEFGLTALGIEARRKRSLAKRQWLMAAVAKLSLTEQKTLIAAIAVIKRLSDQ